MRISTLLFCGSILAAVFAAPAAAKDSRPRSTSPTCPLKCPAGYQVKAYTWELHPERTNYDEQGKTKIADDSLWPITCALSCEQHAPNQETKVWNGTKELCKSGADPAPYRGPWRNSGPFGKQCASLTGDGCAMQCYAVRVPPPARKGSKGGKK